MRVHFTGACGRAMGFLALDLQRRGWKISASDGEMFAPMDKVLRDAGLKIAKGFASRRIPDGTDLLVTGAAVAPDNVEVVAAKRRGIPVLNMAEFIGGRLVKKAKRIVVAGTNGKTTTTAMLAWILQCARRQPDFLIGGICPQFSSSARFRGSRCCVLEGDEYPSAKTDARPKFLHYRPDVVVLTNVEFDHADIYRDEDEVASWFRKLVQGVPREGRIVVAESTPLAMSLAREGAARVDVVGTSARASARVTRLRAARNGMKFRLGGQEFALPLFGTMNALNAALASQAALAAGVNLEQSASALATFCGVAGRLETLVDDARGSLVIDEGYHPSALRENITAMRQRFPRRRLVVILQPRHTGGRDGFQMARLPDVLSKADLVVLTPPFDVIQFPSGRFSDTLLARRLRERGTQVRALRRARRLAAFYTKAGRRGDAVLCCLPAGCYFLTDPLAEAVRALAQR